MNKSLLLLIKKFLRHPPPQKFSTLYPLLYKFFCIFVLAYEKDCVMYTIDFQALMGGGGSPSRPSNDVIDLKIRMYSQRYWKRSITELNVFQRCAMEFILVNYFEYPKTLCAARFQISRVQVHRDLQTAVDLIRKPKIYRQTSDRFLSDIRHIYRYIL